jgi:hypothetical protein
VSLGCQLKEYALVSDSCGERAGKIRKREARPDAFFCYGRRDPSRCLVHVILLRLHTKFVQQPQKVTRIPALVSWRWKATFT